MKRSTWLVGVGAAIFVIAGQGAFAQAAASGNTQQDKMKSCNADAKSKNLSGDDRKAFMKTCLSAAGDTSAAKGNSQQEKMKSCNADAKSKGLKGDDRKAYMKTCLSGSSSS
jgi:psiF repeat